MSLKHTTRKLAVGQHLNSYLRIIIHLWACDNFGYKFCEKSRIRKIYHFRYSSIFEDSLVCNLTQSVICDTSASPYSLICDDQHAYDPSVTKQIKRQRGFLQNYGLMSTWTLFSFRGTHAKYLRLKSWCWIHGSCAFRFSFLLYSYKQ